MSPRASCEKVLVCAACALVLPTTSCWPTVKIEGAPCPCPTAYACCETLSICIRAGDICPESYPPSSNAPCARDQDCAIGEICYAWSVEGTGLSGPQSCQRDCTASFACASPEICSLVPHDGVALQNVDVIRACTDSNPVVGCEQAGCQGCDPSRLGTTYCEDKATHACFLSLHPICGVICASQMIQDCGPAGCMDSGTGACNSNPNGNPCNDFPCSACPNPTSPEQFSCVDTTQIKGCVVAQFAGETCDRICQVLTLGCPEGSVCVEGTGAHCEP